MFYYFYIIQSKKNGKLYLGYTQNLNQRINSHNIGKNSATKLNIPYELIFYSGFKDKTDALKRIHKMIENSLKY